MLPYRQDERTATVSEQELAEHGLFCLVAGEVVGLDAGGAGLLVAADGGERRPCRPASLTATAGGYFLLFTSSSLATALPAAAAVAMSGSMSLVIQQTVLQRVIPGAVLGRVSAVFLTGEAAATLTGSVAGPFIAQAAHLVAVAAAASLLTLSAAALAFLTVPRTPAIVTCGPPLSGRHAETTGRAAGQQQLPPELPLGARGPGANTGIAGPAAAVVQGPNDRRSGSGTARRCR
jgi:hypothetical protein